MAEGAAAGARARAGHLLAHLAHPVTRVLDFGAGCGHLVAAFRDLGLAADGIEPSLAARDRAASEYGLQLRTDLAEYAAEEYDLITLVHSLEHVDQPLTVLQALASRLKSSGTLFVEVPHAGSIELWRPARRRWILDLPMHLFHFTPESLGRLVSAAGLKVGRTELFNCDAVEWLIRQRARAVHGAAVEAVTSGMESGGRADNDHAGRGWASRVVLHLRRLAPGWNFQVFASHR